MPERLKRFERNGLSRHQSGTLLLCGLLFSALLRAEEITSSEPATTATDPVPGVVYQDQLIEPGLDERLFEEEFLE